MKRTIQLVAVLLVAANAAFAQTASPELDRATPIAPGEAHSFQLPPLEEASLKRGMTLALEQVGRLPLVSVRLVLPFGGSAFDPEGKAGLAELVASLMMEGTRKIDGRSFAEKIEELGASLSIAAQADAMTATLFVTKENLDKALGLMAKMVREPALPATELPRLIQEKQLGLEQEKGDPGALAERRLSSRVFGDHPYGRSADSASVGALTLGDVKAFHAGQLRPETAILAVSGDVAMPELKALASKHFGSWKSAGGAVGSMAEVPAIPEVDPSAPAAGMLIEVVDLPGAQQSAIRAGHRSIQRDAPDYFETAVMNFLLGQAPITSRLENNLRERHGWAYGAGSSIAALRKGGIFSIHADVQTDATGPAVREILGELSRLRENPVPAEELESVKRLMAGLFVLRQQTVQSIATQVAGIELYGLSKDTLARYRERVLAVTPEQVQAAAQRHLRAGELQIIIAGDADKIKGELGLVAPVRVFDVDGKPKSGEPAS